MGGRCHTKALCCARPITHTGGQLMRRGRILRLEACGARSPVQTARWGTKPSLLRGYLWASARPLRGIGSAASLMWVQRDSSMDTRATPVRYLRTCWRTPGTDAQIWASCSAVMALWPPGSTKTLWGSLRIIAPAGLS